MKYFLFQIILNDIFFDKYLKLFFTHAGNRTRCNRLEGGYVTTTPRVFNDNSEIRTHENFVHILYAEYIIIAGMRLNHSAMLPTILNT